MVTQHEVRMRGHDYFRIRPCIAIGRRNIILVKGLIIHVHLSAVDTNSISRHPDYALDVALRRVPRIPKYHHIAAFNGLQAIDKLVDEDPLLVSQRRHHAGTFNFHRLVNEDNNESRNRHRNEQITQP